MSCSVLEKSTEFNTDTILTRATIESAYSQVGLTHIYTLLKNMSQMTKISEIGFLISCEIVVLVPTPSNTLFSCLSACRRTILSHLNKFIEELLLLLLMFITI